MPQQDKGMTFNFDVCSRCKLMCCQGANPPLTTRRRKIITEYLREHNLPSDCVFVDGEYCHPAADEQGYCMLFDKQTGKCSVHPVKPETCKAGPVTFDINLKTGMVEWFLKNSEICAFAGQLYEDKTKFQEHLQEAKTEIFRLISDLEAKPFQAILRIPEPQTFKIGENEVPKLILDKLETA